MSRYFEDFTTGESFRSRGRTITEADIVTFAGLTGDWTELHTNEEYARRSPFGRRIAHGALVFSISNGLMTQMNLVGETVLAFYGLDHLRFTRPVFIGDTVHVEKTVAGLAARDEARGVLTFDSVVRNQHGDTVIVYRDKVLLKRRPGTLEAPAASMP